MKYQPVAKIKYQGTTIQKYLVPSKSSKPGQSHAVRFTKTGKRECSCIGDSWLKKKVDDVLADCRHKKLVTIYVHADKTHREYLKDALRYAMDPSRNLEVVWAITMCQQPDKYNPIALHCKSCELYPEICNIHKIYIKRNKLPLVWKLQGQVFAGKRKAAAQTIRKIIKAVNQ